jgi:hypothetical protein
MELLNGTHFGIIDFNIYVRNWLVSKIYKIIGATFEIENQGM